MLNLQIDQTALTNAIATIIATELLKNTPAPSLPPIPVHSTDRTTDDATNNILTTIIKQDNDKYRKERKYNEALRMRIATEKMSNLSWTAPTPSERALYNAWIAQFGYTPVTAATFLAQIKTTADIRLTAFLRASNTATGVGLKLSEYAAHHPWLKRIPALSINMYGVPKN